MLVWLEVISLLVQEGKIFGIGICQVKWKMLLRIAKGSQVTAFDRLSRVKSF